MVLLSFFGKPLIYCGFPLIFVLKLGNPLQIISFLPPELVWDTSTIVWRLWESSRSILRGSEMLRQLCQENTTEQVYLGPGLEQ